MRGIIRRIIIACTVILLVIIIVFIVVDYSNSNALQRYNSVGNAGVTGDGLGDKKLNFLVSYLQETKDYNLQFALGKKDSGMSSGVGGSSDSSPNNGSSDGGNFIVPEDADELRQLILAAQGSNASSAASCDAVFKIIYPNTSNTYTSLKSWGSGTKQKIEQMNSGLMSNCKVKVWRFKNPGIDSSDLEKVTVEIDIQCCTALHPIVKAMFEEVYNHPSKPVVCVVGGYSVRPMNNDTGGSGSTSTHSYGSTLDLNYSYCGQNVKWNWNKSAYGQVYPRSKAEWDKLPETQYKYVCMYEGCPIVEIFRQYGYYWGGAWKQKSCDPMHFSVFNH